MNVIELVGLGVAVAYGSSGSFQQLNVSLLYSFQNQLVCVFGIIVLLEHPIVSLLFDPLDQ